MTALQYLESLIAGQKCSSIGVQTCELEFLRILMLTQGKNPPLPKELQREPAVSKTVA